MPAFWHWFVVVGTVIFVIWCAWLISWSAKQGPKDVADEDVVGHKWDGDIEEWNNPAPKWWLYLYFITIVWAVGYMIAYPGLGSFKGALGWSQQGQYEEEMEAAASRYEPIYEKFAAMEFDELANNAEANQLGKSLYASYCTTCHGSDARGAPGYPNLTDNDWIWGNSEPQLYASIYVGRNALMPAVPTAFAATDQDFKDLTRYVRSLSGLVEADDAARAKAAVFAGYCASCHGADGTGNPMLGAPNLTDDIWLYGSSEDAVYATLVEGRNGMMPAHGNLLGENRTKILAAYVYSLSQ